MTAIALQSLSHHISAIPTLDKEQFVLSFIQEQKGHSKVYVQEGQDLVASWNHQVLLGPQAATEYGFGTPVLKPRVPLNISGSPYLPAHHDCAEMVPSHIESRQRPVKRKPRSLAQNAKRKARSGSENHHTSDDGEQAKRASSSSIPPLPLIQHSFLKASRIAERENARNVPSCTQRTVSMRRGAWKIKRRRNRVARTMCQPAWRSCMVSLQQM